MKNILYPLGLIPLLIVITLSTVYGQTNDTSKAKTETPLIFSFVEQMPEFPGGDKALSKYLKDSIKYPAKAEEQGIKGTVYIQFVVNNNGALSDFKVVRSPDELLSTEGLRVFRSMPKWKPGKQNGQVVDCYYVVPVNFKLGLGIKKHKKD